jgi:branched-chain amino acid transport system substrate-binding protein
MALIALNAAIGFTSANDVAAAEAYHLGVALPSSGVGASYSKDGIDAIELAVEEINNAGGFLGKHPIKLFIRDTQTKADVGANMAREMIQRDRVRCILGTYASDVAIAIKPICREHKVLHIAAISNSENLTKLDFSPYTYSVVPNSYMQARAVAIGVARMAKRYNWKDYVTIASDYEWGRSTQANFVKLLKEVAPDLQLIKEYWPRQGEKDFGPFIKTIMDEKPGFAYGCLAAQDTATWIDQAKQVGFFGKVPYPGSLISVWELINHAQTQPRGMIGLCRAPFFAHLNVPMMVDFVKAFRAKYNRYPSDWAVLEYDAVYVLKQGIEKAGNVDSDAVKDALKGMTVRTTRGELSFRPIDNQLGCSSYLGRVADDEAYPFPVYHSIIEVKGPDSWRPESEIIAARQTEKK